MILENSREYHQFNRGELYIISLTEPIYPYDYVVFSKAKVCPDCGHTPAFCRCKR